MNKPQTANPWRHMTFVLSVIVIFQSLVIMFPRPVKETVFPVVFDESVVHGNSFECPKDTHWTKADRGETRTSAVVMCELGKPDPLPQRFVSTRYECSQGQKCWTAEMQKDADEAFGRDR